MNPPMGASIKFTGYKTGLEWAHFWAQDKQYVHVMQNQSFEFWGMREFPNMGTFWQF